VTGHLYIVDDDTGFRESLAALGASVGFTVDQFSDPQAIFEIPDLGRPGCVILDYRLPTFSGMQALVRLRSISSIPIILVSAFASVKLTMDAMRAGASMVFEKPLDDNEFVEAIEQLCLKDVDASQPRVLCDSIRQNLGTLTEVEAAVLDQLLANKGNKEIAHSLGKGVKSVERYRTKILSKLGYPTIAAALLAVKVCPLQSVSPLNCVGLCPVSNVEVDFES